MSIPLTQLAGEREEKSHQCGRQRETGYGGSQLHGLEKINSKDHRRRTADEEKMESNWKNRR